MRVVLWGGLVLIVLGAYPSLGAELAFAPAPVSAASNAPATEPLSDVSSLVASDCGACNGVGHWFNPPGQDCRAAELIAQLSSCSTRDRQVAARKLGNAWNVNIQSHPEVVVALITALQCDSAWEVRNNAAWAIAFQNVANQSGWTCLYVASKLDPHWMVRDTAANAMKVIEARVCLDCIKSWKTRADSLVKQWKGRYNPGKSEPVLIY